MTTPTTEKPSFEVVDDDPPLNFPPYEMERTGHQTYLDYEDEGDEHSGSGHMSEKSPRSGHTTEARDALDVIARKSWLDNPLAKVVVWLLLMVAVYRIYLRVTG